MRVKLVSAGVFGEEPHCDALYTLALRPGSERAERLDVGRAACQKRNLCDTLL